MSMVTTCPQCHTRFKVTQQQLQAHHGDVRCGRCAHVFDAFASLAPEEMPPEKIEPAAVEEPSAVVEPVPAEAAETVPESRPAEPFETEAPVAEVEKVSAPEPIEPQPQEPMEAQAEAPEAPVAPVAEEFHAAPVVEAELPPALEAPQPERRRTLGWLWLIGVLFMLLVLAGQGVYFFRNQLAAYYPETRPALQQACDLLGCRIGLLREADLLSIESSDLQADPAHAGLVTVTATLRNRAPFPQAYPQLELTLTDARDQMVARRILSAVDYAPEADRGLGFPARSDLAVKLHADLGDLKAAGYRLYLFYPQ